ncbi:BatD family protein [Pseudoalteromonas sp. GB56]
MVRSLVIFCLVCFSLPALALTKLDASVDKNPVLAGEFFYLTLSADDTINAEQPDTSALLKHFVVGPTSRSNQTQIINGSVSRQTTWRIELMARNPGEYEVPAFRLKNISSAPFTMKVVANTNAQIDADNAFIKTELTPSTLYVQQAGIYTVKLYLGVDLIDGALSAPELENANISQMGKNSESQEVVNGRRYQVIQRDYLIQPQKSGTFELKAPMLNGKARKNYRAVSITAKAPDQLVEVKPTPAQFAGAWLPSELVDLSEQWQGLEDEVQVGTPITRTLTLTALNVTKEQLPDIANVEVADVRSYPDQSDRTHLVRNGRLIAQTKTSIAYVPQRPGTFTLPAIEVNWFNTVTGRAEVASVPEQTITVVGNGNIPATATPAPSSTDALSTAAPQQVQQLGVVTQNNSLTWWLIIPGYLLWLVTMLLWWLSRKTKQTEAHTTVKRAQPSTNVNDISRAAKAQDAKALYHAVDSFAKVHHGSIENWIVTWPENAQQAFANLRQSLYSANSTMVDFSLIAQAAAKKSTSDTQSKSKLDSLY